MNIGIVGSRTFPQLQLVDWFIRDLPSGVTIVSGGAQGVDKAAVYYARQYGHKYVEYLPDISKGQKKERWEIIKAYYDRNQQIVDGSHFIVAFTEKQKGGTWDTIKRARKAGKPVKIIKPCLFLGGEEETKEPEVQQEPEEKIENKKGKGPFQLKRISLGSYALKLWRYIDDIEWADFVNGKDDSPKETAEKLIPDFLNFFKDNPPGVIHAITQAPKSMRHKDKLHIMDFVCNEVSQELNVPYIEMFSPWEKDRRSAHARHGKLTVLPNVKDYIGKVVYVLDDVSTTNRTLSLSVNALLSIGVHAHGVTWVYYS